MLASEMIAALQDMIAEHGDLPVMAEHHTMEWNDFTFDPVVRLDERFLPPADLMVIPKDEDGHRAWKERVRQVMLEHEDEYEDSVEDTIDRYGDDDQTMLMLAMACREDDLQKIIVIKVDDDKPLMINGVPADDEGCSC